MLSLRELQADFASEIFSGAVRGGLLADQAGFGIYRNNVFSNYREALHAVHPVLLKLVGRDFFDHVAKRYIAASPSTSGDLTEYGRGFAEFIAGFSGAENLVYLPDVARLEWLIHESFHSADYPEIALDFATNISAERFETLNFALHPACRLIASPYPILRIWQANQEGAADETIDLSEGGCNVLIARPEYEVELRLLATGEFVMLKEFAAGKSFGEAFSSTIEADLKFNVVRFMQTHVAARTLVDFSVARGMESS